MGLWILNLAKSSFEGVPAPTSERRTLAHHGDGMMLNTNETVTERGQSFSHYIVAFDGKRYPEYSRQGGPKQIASLSFKRPDLRTIEVEGKNNNPNGEFTGTWIVSSDGKTLTITLLGKNAEGKPTKRVRVYDKQ